MKAQKFALVSDSSCDLPEDLAAKKGIQVVPFYVSFDGETYKREMAELEVHDFYAHMVDHPGVYPKSSMPSVQDYADVFLPLAEAGIPILCICITVKFSGSMQSALSAADLVREQYGDAQIEVMDAAMNTVLQGLFVLEAAHMRDDGLTLTEAVRALMSIRDSGRIFFTTGSLDYLQKGGRIGKVAAAAASVLGIRPIITLKQGEIFPCGIARSRKRSLDKVLALLTDYMREINGPASAWRLTVGYGYDKEEGGEFLNQVKTALAEAGFPETTLWLNQIGATIGVHTGPYPLGIGIIRRYR